jgi:hypothetical protein
VEAVKQDLVTRKYVILRHREQDRFIAGCIVIDRYHANIFGERPQEVWGDEWYLFSAGYYTWEVNKPETVRVHGNSVGFRIGPSHHDTAILCGYLNNHATEYDHEGNPLE